MSKAKFKKYEELAQAIDYSKPLSLTNYSTKDDFHIELSYPLSDKNTLKVTVGGQTYKGAIEHYGIPFVKVYTKKGQFVCDIRFNFMMQNGEYQKICNIVENNFTFIGMAA